MSKRTTSSRPEPRLATPWRIIISLAIAFHLLAVFVAPWAGPPPNSRVARDIAESFHWYNNLTHTLKGYRFFAPAPGPSHLVKYELTFADGTTKKGQFPDLNEQFPRLLYHRYFMLAEHLNELNPPRNDVMRAAIMSRTILWNMAAPCSTAGISIANQGLEALEYTFRDNDPRMQAIRKLYEAYLEGFAAQLLKDHHATKVHIYLQEHRFPLVSEFESGWKLTDPRLYLPAMDLGEFTADEVP